ncbi:MAG TPA: M50 family metallopeptidase, partial [Kofleriaceae bacterium]
MTARRPRNELRTLALALLASLLLWNLPFGGVLLYPFKLFATWLHELSHGIALILTGAGFDHIVVYRDTSGLAYAYTSVGSFGTAIIAAAGYMGTPLWGAALLVITPTAKAARRALLVLSGLLIGTTILVI